MSPRRVVVIGGGIAGLTAAHALLRRGFDPLLLEASTRVGGKIRSEREGGLLTEWGPASFVPSTAESRDLLRDLGLDDQVVPAAPAAGTRCVVADGRLHRVPRTVAEMIRTALLSPRGKARLLGELLVRRGPAARGADESVAAFARRRFGREAAERLFFPLASGLYAGDPESLSLPSAFPRFAELERTHRSLLRGGFARSLTGRDPSAGLQSFAGGMEVLPRALAARLGTRVRRSARVLEITAPGNRLRLAVDDAGALTSVDADAVVLATPAHASAVLVRAVSPRLSDALAGISYAPVVLVELCYATRAFARPPDAYGFLVAPGEDLRLLGAVFLSCLFPSAAPPGTVVVSARLGGARRREDLALGDSSLVDIAHRELALLLGIREPPRRWHVVRNENALPQYTLGHGAHVAAVESAAARIPGLFLTGSALRGAAVPDCIADAEREAGAVVRHLKKR